MSTYSTENTEREGTDAETDDQSRADRLASTLKRHTRSGTLPILAGGALVVRALRSSGRGGRTIVQGAIGAGLIALGVRRRRSGGGGVEIPLDEVIASDDEEGEVSAEAAAHADQQRVLQQDEQNPRGTSGEPDVETETGPDEGDVRFHDDQDLDPETEPHMDEDGPHDSRMDDQIGDDGDSVDVDLSEAAMADEVSEATGPNPEQAQPASTEGTEPEQTPSEDASHMEADKPSGEEASDDETTDDEETAGDANAADGGEVGDDEDPTDESDGDDEAPTANGDGDDEAESLTDD